MNEQYEDMDQTPSPRGELMTQTLVMPIDTNASGDVYGGWLMSKMDLAGSLKASYIANGRVTTVAAGNMVFLRPVTLGSAVSCYAHIQEVGRSSVRVLVDVWLRPSCSREILKLTESEFVYVAIDDNGRTRPINSGD